MLKIPNAFNFRVADQSVLDPARFLTLYAPTVLDQLNADDFSAPKLIVLNGSPGSGKTSLLRLFETTTLISLCNNQSDKSENLKKRLNELGVIDEKQPKYFGIYVLCDSSLRDVANLPFGEKNDSLLNTLLDLRIIGGFVRSLEMLSKAFPSPKDLHKLELKPLAPEHFPPPLFAQSHTVKSLKEGYEDVEKAFAKLLNSFPGDPFPEIITPHSRIFSILYLNQLIKETEELQRFLPIIMLDDLHELYEAQRKRINAHFLERSAIPRWIAVRKHVYELEELISLEDAKDNRDFREINLDSSTQFQFRKFVENVANKRLNMSSSLQQYDIQSFLDQIVNEQDTVPFKTIEKEFLKFRDYLIKIGGVSVLNNSSLNVKTAIESDAAVSIAELIEIEAKLIILERHRNKPQLSLFESEIIEDENVTDGKVRDAAKLFTSKRYKIPYYFTFNTLADTANGNVEQFLSTASLFADKMISRAELSNDNPLSPYDQEKLLRNNAERYFVNLEQRFERGYTIKQLVENLGRFFHAVTYRSNAPYAPGVNGFGFDRETLRSLMKSNKNERQISAFREILTTAVAGNVLTVKQTKQGQAGAEKIVFYLNKLLCVKFDLPLSSGGWQPIKFDLLIQMITRSVTPTEWNKSWVEPLLGGLDS